MKFADVAVNSPINSRNTFCYSIPSQMTVAVGHAVWVPFGSKVLQGLVLNISDYPSVEVTRDIDSLISPDPLLTSSQVELGVWLSQRYLAPLFDSIALMLPPGFERRLITMIGHTPTPVEISEISPDQKTLLHILDQHGGTTDIRHVEKRMGKRKAVQTIRISLQQKLIVESTNLEKIRVRPRVVQHIKLSIDRSAAEVKASQLRESGARKQAAVLDYLLEQSQPVALPELKKSIPCQQAVIALLQEKGVISVFPVESRRDPLTHIPVNITEPPVMTNAQAEAQKVIRETFTAPDTDEPPIVLLHGVTGSGKTEIYLRILADLIAQGKKGICLVPEISLTPLIIERFTSRFPGRVGVMHSGLSLGEQFDEWQRIRDGECDVVIGPRSALFVPQPNLGLIIIDEEHEWTYKQTDRSPRYHARDVAVKLAELSTGTVVILGSATPDVETYYKAERGEYKLIELKERVTPRGIAELPTVELVDLRAELKMGNRSLLSRPLQRAIANVLGRGEQVILFLNRRGMNTYIQCTECGFVFGCRRCDASLIYHSATSKLVCHHCRQSYAIPAICPQCNSHHFRYMGVGTERVEKETKHLFPQARILRWDLDAASNPRAHADLLAKFKAREADILVGTQMIAKGLDFPEVTLAGVISADTALNQPDFRAGERTFQLLCQLAGRAGRGLLAGRVIIQTYNPDHYAIRAASDHDYITFYRQEIDYRKQFRYPPFSKMARLVYSHANADVCRREAEKTSMQLTSERDRKGAPDIRIIGPTPAFVPRLRGRYQWQIFIVGREPGQFLSPIDLSRGWIVDIDPLGVV
jgi:primosomal protein N' (replication factor Y)